MRCMTGVKRLTLLASILLLGWPGGARAADPPGTYVVSACRAGDQPAPLAGWYVEGPGASHILDFCAQGAGFGISSAGQTSWMRGEYRRWVWDAPADVAAAGVRLWFTLGVGHLLDYQFLAGTESVALSQWVQPAESLNLNSTRLSIGLGCRNPEGCLWLDAPVAQPYIRVSRVEMVLRDLLAPEAQGVPTGSLLEPGPVGGLVEIASAFRDRGAGLKSAALLVDGAQRDEHRVSEATCAQPYVAPVPCPLSGRVRFALDTTAVADGDHRVEIALEDVAGNRSLIGPFSVTVRNKTLPPTTRPGRLSLSSAVVRTSGKPKPRLDGTLTDLDGVPIAGAQIDVASRPRMRGSAFAPTAPAVTSADGRFSVPIGPGTSRVIRVRYAASEATAEVIVPAPVAFAATPSSTRNGRAVRFSGRIPGTSVSGPRVELQARADGKWVPFRTVALRQGRFSARYRFTRTTFTTRYRFRAVVRAVPDFPYAAGQSKIVRVLVRP